MCPLSVSLALCDVDLYLFCVFAYYISAVFFDADYHFLFFQPNTVW